MTLELTKRMRVASMMSHKSIAEHQKAREKNKWKSVGVDAITVRHARVVTELKVHFSCNHLSLALIKFIIRHNSWTKTMTTV